MTACQGLEIEIFITETSTFSLFKGISCIGSQSCQEADISIINRSPNFISIQNLDCSAFQSCQLAEFALVNVGFDSCNCVTAGQQGCDGTIGIDSCSAGLEKLECLGVSGCQGQTRTVVDVLNDFELVCGDMLSCSGFNLNLILTSGDVTFIKGYKCGGENSCNGAQIILTNQQNNNETLFIEKIECGSIGSCGSAVFNFIGDVVVEEVICGGMGSCDGCLMNGIACNSV